MDKIGLWFWYSAKRQLKHKMFCFLWILLPLILMGASYLEKEDTEGIRIAVYAAAPDSLTKTVMESLVSQTDGSFSFYECGSLEQLQEDVAGKRAECGYFFSEDLEEKLDQKKGKRSIEVYSSPSSMTESLSTEIVFAHIMEIYGKELYMDYVTGETMFRSVENVREDADSLWKKYTENGSTFSFVYETADGARLETRIGKAGFPARGIVAVYVFMVGLFGSVMQAQDEKKGLWIPVAYGQKTGCRLVSLAAPVMLAALSGLVGLWLAELGARPGAAGAGASLAGMGAAGNWSVWWYEIAVMVAYGAGVTAFSYALKSLVKKPEILAALIPFFLVGSLLLCPVVIDIGRFLPELAPISKCFLPYYYLKAF